jgi:hypothetical protein
MLWLSASLIASLDQLTSFAPVFWKHIILNQHKPALSRDEKFNLHQVQNCTPLTKFTYTQFINLLQICTRWRFDVNLVCVYKFAHIANSIWRS